MHFNMMNMFATPLYKASLGREFTAQEIACFQKLLKGATPAISNYASVNKRVLNSPELSDLRQVLEQHLASYFKTVYNSANQVCLQPTQSWLTLSRKGESHHPHTHPNSVVSGVLYINVAAEDGISFHRNEDHVWHELLPAQENYFNAKRYFVQTLIGDILLFPSHVRHSVREVTEDIERVSLSFNTFFSGMLGQEEFSNFLKVSIE